MTKCVKLTDEERAKLYAVRIPPPNCREMIEAFLMENDYDGLCNVEAECGCGLEDLFP